MIYPMGKIPTCTMLRMKNAPEGGVDTQVTEMRGYASVKAISSFPASLS